MSNLFDITEFMAESADDSAIFVYALNTLEKRVLKLSLDNISRPYLWRDWQEAQDILERIYMADITPYLSEIVEAIKGMGGGGATGSLSINCCLGSDGAGTSPLPEETVDGDYDGTGGVPDYTEEDELFSFAVANNCRKAHYAAHWVAELLNSVETPNPSTTESAALASIANRTIAQNSINTATKLLPSTGGAVVIDGATGQIVRGATAIGQVPRGGTLAGVFLWVFTEVSAWLLRRELAKWQNTSVIGNILGSSPSLSVVKQRFVEAGLTESNWSIRRLLGVMSGTGPGLTAVGDVGLIICQLWWVAISRGWNWFPPDDALAAMFPSVSCSYTPGSLVVRRFINSVAPVDYTANGTGGHQNFDILQIGSGHSQSRVWVSQKRLKWHLNDTSWETGTPSLWRVRLYEYLPPIDMDSTTLITWLESNIGTYPPSYEFMLDQYMTEDAAVPFYLRGYIMQISSSGNGGTLGFRVEEA